MWPKQRASLFEGLWALVGKWRRDALRKSGPELVFILGASPQHPRTRSGRLRRMLATTSRVVRVSRPLFVGFLVGAVFFLAFTRGFGMHNKEDSIVQFDGQEAGNVGAWSREIAESPRWELQPFEDVPGSYVARDSQSFACFLLVPHACHAFRGYHTERSGVWYSSQGYDLSTLAIPDDVCGHGKFLPSPLWGANDVNTIVGSQEKMGRFVPDEEVSKDEEDPSHPERVSVVDLDVGIVAPRDSHLGHFVEVVGALSELVDSITATASHASTSTTWAKASVFFPFDWEVSDWATEMSKVIFGGGIDVVPGRDMTMRHCFAQAVFLLNTLHSPEAAGTLRSKAFAALKLRDTPEPLPDVSPGKDEGPGPILTNSNFAHSIRAPNAAPGDVLLPSPPLQVTVVRRQKIRTVTNMDDVIRTVEQAFPQLRVESFVFSNQTFLSQVATMQRTAFFLTMHGASMSNLIFMENGTSLVELFPYKFNYGPYRRLALRFGVKYFSWSNTRLESSVYADDCLERGGFDKLTEPECHKLPQCRWCVRDRAATTVDLTELRETLGRASREVGRWQNMRSSLMRRSY